ncbi:MAG TPA: DUF2497 domain-containing protein [Acidiphilium sp.]
MSVSNQPIGNEPTMDEILASIRSAIRNDEPPLQVAPKAPDPAGTADSVLVLDASMMVPDQEPRVEAPTSRAPLRTPAQEPIASSPMLSTAAPDDETASQIYEPLAGAAPLAGAVIEPDQKSGSVEAPPPLIGALAAETISAQFGALVRTVAADRALAVTRDGPTVEQIVREEIRPLLKSWMDAHLPGLVERMIRAEIERVVGRDPL